jgi:murein L,D-transpeptidase YcbB/YkuD
MAQWPGAFRHHAPEARSRQFTGPMKFMFPNLQGIWLHDTPEKEKIEDAPS